MNSYILEGPADCGNMFGYLKRGLVRAGKFALVSKGEYTNGGYGPSTVDGKLYASREAVQAALDRINAPA